jgi:hypothetical protein
MKNFENNIGPQISCAHAVSVKNKKKKVAKPESAFSSWILSFFNSPPFILYLSSQFIKYFSQSSAQLCFVLVAL